MLKSVFVGLIATAIAAGAGFASDRSDKSECDDILEDAYEEISDFQRDDPSEREMKRFLDRLADDIDEDDYSCKFEMAFLVGASSDDRKSDDNERRKRSGKRNDSCEDVIEDAYEEISDFQRGNPSERKMKRFLDRLTDDLDEDDYSCKGQLTALVSKKFDDKKSKDDKRRKRSGKRDDFCEDVVEDVLEELEEYDEDKDGRSNRRAKYVRYLIKDLDRDERKCVKFLADKDNDVSPHKAKNSFDVKKWSYGRWSS